MQKFTAIVFTSPNVVEIGEYELPEMRTDEVLVRTEYSGISQGTEIYALLGKRPELGFPTVPGYQSVGRVEALGDAVARSGRLRIGQRVFFGSTRLPESLTPTWMGAHVSHGLVNAMKDPITCYDVALPIGEEADPRTAALAALPAVSARGLDMLRINIGDLVVVTGQGLIGQSSAQLARLRGATVVAADVHAARLDLSLANSADKVVNVRQQNLADVVRAIKPGGADVVIDTTGRSDGFAGWISLLRTQGQLLLQGWYPEPISFDFDITHGSRPTVAITSGFDTSGTSLMIDLMSQGKLKFANLITDLVPFHEAPVIYAKLLNNDPHVLGVVFDWTKAGI